MGPGEKRGPRGASQKNLRCYIWKAKEAAGQRYQLFCKGLGNARDKAMAPHSSTLAWKIPWTEEPDRLQSMGSLESDTTERLHFRFSLSCIGKGNGNPLWCSCLENPRDSRAWWAAVYGVAESRTRLKQLSSSSSRECTMAQWKKNPPAMQETRVQSLGQDDPLEKEIATHSSVLTWEIPWTEKPGRQ